MSEVLIKAFTIIISLIGLLLCSTYLLVGVNSPLYKQHPQIILLLICTVLIAFNLVYLFGINVDYESLRDTWDTILILYFALNGYYASSLRIAMFNPFGSKIRKFINFLAIFVFVCIVLFINGEEHRTKTLDLVVRYGCILAVIHFYIQLDLKRTKLTQDFKVYKMKSTYLWQQMIWFYFSLAMQFIYAITTDRLGMLFFMFQNIVFAVCQLQERYAQLKLRSLFGSCSIEELDLIMEIENGGTNGQLNIILLKNAQTIEFVKSVLNGICKTIFQSLKYQSLKYDRKRYYRYYFEFNEQGIDLELKAQTKNQHTRVDLITYYPNHFRDLLWQDQYESQSQIILETLGIQYNRDSYEKTRESLGKSGSFFFFSQNKRMILKTISYFELSAFMKNKRIDQYFNHLKLNPQSKLAKIYGLFTISIVGIDPTSFILMENTLGGLNIDSLYDLKGSTIGRNSIDSDSVYKDNYFLQSIDYPLKICKDEQKIKQQLIQDSAFLCRIGYMDYSLLLGITPILNEDQQISHRIVKVNNYYYAVFSIIDYLQEYNLNKKLEYYFKSIRAKDPNELSCIEPYRYQKRFSNFIHQIIKE